MLALRVANPEAEDILPAVHRISEHRIDGGITDAAFGAHGDVHAIHEGEGVERFQRARLPFLHGFHDVIRDVGNLLGRELEPIDFVDGLGDVALAHAAPVHGNDFVFDFGDVALVLRDDLRLERAVAVAGDSDFRLAL